MRWFSFHYADFRFSFLSILFEGAPFLLLGSMLSGAVEAFLPPGALARLLPRNRSAAIFASGLLGAVFPMCECGAVVVIRRFLAKGLPPSCAVAYLLGAPIVNPLVALGTMAAFRGRNPLLMTGLRLAIGYAVAVLAGLVVERLPLASVLQPRVLAGLPGAAGGAPAPSPDPEGAAIPAKAAAGSASSTGFAEAGEPPETPRAPSAAPGQPARGARRVFTVAPMEEPLLDAGAPVPFTARLAAAARSGASDFLDVAVFFVIGAALAATLNTAVDQAVIQPLARTPALAVPVMMGLAGAMALCSSTDAFIAASFTAFPFAAKLAFLLFGPVFDVKLVFLYSLVFRRRFIAGLVAGLFLVIALLCLRLSLLNL